MTHRHNHRTYQSLFLLLFKLLDIVLLIASGMIVYKYIDRGFVTDSTWKAVVMIAVLTFTLLAPKLHLYQPWRGKKLRHELSILALLSLVTVGGVAMACKAVGIFPVSTEVGPIAWAWFVCLASALASVRLIVRPGLKILRRHGVNQRRVALVGMSPELDDYVEELRDHPEFGFAFVGYLDDRKDFRSYTTTELEHLGSTADLAAICQELEIDQIWFGYPVDASNRLAEVINLLNQHPIVMRQIIDLATPSEEIHSITSILGRPLLDIDVTFTDDIFGHLAKFILDKVLAASILLAVSPLMLVIALAVKMSSPGPVFYRQTRLTWRNQPFEIIKFRTMPVDAEKHSGPTWATSNQNRATRVGAFLRATSLDELPQFWNVLKGEMSVVGPRPERPELVEQFKHQIPLYMKKHRVKAGITGWAQVNGYRGNTDLIKRIEYDLHYIRNNSLWFDIQIIFITMFKGFVHRNAY